jgi:hypothetical protein
MAEASTSELPVPVVDDMLAVHDEAPVLAASTEPAPTNGKRRASKSAKASDGIKTSPQGAKKRLRVGPRASIACHLCR